MEILVTKQFEANERLGARRESWEVERVVRMDEDRIVRGRQRSNWLLALPPVKFRDLLWWWVGGLGLVLGRGTGSEAHDMLRVPARAANFSAPSRLHDPVRS